MRTRRRAMLKQVHRHWRRMADELTAPTKPRGVGFMNDWRYAVEIGYWFVMAKQFPATGGLRAQSEADIHDLKMYLRGLNYYRWLLADQERREPITPEDSEPATDWKAFA